MYAGTAPPPHVLRVMGLAPEEDPQQQPQAQPADAAEKKYALDMRGIRRGGCLDCGPDECVGYEPPAKSKEESKQEFACRYCGCPPAKHQNMEALLQQEQEKLELERQDREKREESRRDNNLLPNMNTSFIHDESPPRKAGQGGKPSPVSGGKGSSRKSSAGVSNLSGDKDAGGKDEVQDLKKKLTRVESESGSLGKPLVHVKSYTVKFSTRLASGMTAQEAAAKLSLRFPGGAEKYRLFMDESDGFHLLDADSQLSDAPGWGHNAKLRFMKKSWPGNGTRQVKLSAAETAARMRKDAKKRSAPSRTRSAGEVAEKQRPVRSSTSAPKAATPPPEKPGAGNRGMERSKSEAIPRIPGSGGKAKEKRTRSKTRVFESSESTFSSADDEGTSAAAVSLSLYVTRGTAETQVMKVAFETMKDATFSHLCEQLGMRPGDKLMLKSNMKAVPMTDKLMDELKNGSTLKIIRKDNK